jgi:signal transduction histidine kinase
MPESASRAGGHFADGIPPALLAELLRHLPTCVGLYDLGGTCVLASEALARWLDRPLAEILGCNVEQLWPEKFGEAILRRHQQAHPGMAQTVEEFPRGNSRRPVRVVRFPWCGTSGEVVGVVELFEEQASVTHAEVVGRLALGVAHDFNNTLTLLQGHLDLLDESLNRDSRAARQIGELRLVLEHASQLPQQLVRFVHGSGSGTHPIDLNTLLTSLERLLRPRLEAGVSLRLELAGGGAWVEGDPVQLTQVLLNLAGNALDAMPSGGELLLRCERLAGGGGADSVEAGPYIRLTIRDTGVGMTAEVQRRMFEPLFTTRSRGTGLGLSVVQELVHRHGGVVRCQSAAGQGTTFQVLLPARASSARAEGTKPVARGEAVLVLERNHDVRHLAGMILAHGRFTPVLCADFHEARQLSINPDRPIRLIVVDAELCAGQGEELLVDLLGRHCRAELLYTSAGDLVPLAAGLPAPHSIVLKPFRAEQLLQAVEAALAD